MDSNDHHARYKMSFFQFPISNNERADLDLTKTMLDLVPFSVEQHVRANVLLKRNLTLNNKKLSINDCIIGVLNLSVLKQNGDSVHIKHPESKSNGHSYIS